MNCNNWNDIYNSINKPAADTASLLIENHLAIRKENIIMVKNLRTGLASLLLSVCFLVTLLAGCAPNNNEDTPFQMVFTSLYINNAAVSDYTDSLIIALPELSVDGKAPLFTSMIMGEVENDIESGIINDPIMAMAGMMKMTALISSGEIDIIVSDIDNAARNARGGMFMPLDEIFTVDELNAMNGRLLYFDLIDYDGDEATPTGEITPICGIDISENEMMKQIFGAQEIGVFIVVNANNLDLAKEVMLTLI